MATLPTPLRAALGLVITAVDEAKRLPDKAIEFPMLAVSSALKITLRAQQRYTALAARGDELLSGRSITDAPPAWATFDEAVEEPVAEDTGAVTEFDTGGTGDTGDTGNTGDTRWSADGEPARSAQVATPRKSTPAKRASKSVRAPRTGAPSAFDSVGDDD